MRELNYTIKLPHLRNLYRLDFAEFRLCEYTVIEHLLGLLDQQQRRFSLRRIHSWMITASPLGLLRLELDSGRSGGLGSTRKLRVVILQHREPLVITTLFLIFLLVLFIPKGIIDHTFTHIL